MMDITEEIDPNRIHGIVRFMREATTMIDPDEALAKFKLDDIERFTESQITYCLVKFGVENSHLKTLFLALQETNTRDIKLLNSENDIMSSFVNISGALYYAKSVRRLITKKDILVVREMLSPAGYEFVFNFSSDPACIEDYPVTQDFAAHFYAVGYKITQTYLKNISGVITSFLEHKLELQVPERDVLHLRISNEYALELGLKTRDYIINNLMN